MSDTPTPTQGELISLAAGRHWKKLWPELDDSEKAAWVRYASNIEARGKADDEWLRTEQIYADHFRSPVKAMSDTPLQYVLRDAKTGEVLREAHDYEVRQAFGARLNGGRPGGGCYVTFVATVVAASATWKAK